MKSRRKREFLLISDNEPSSILSESFRAIGTSLHFSAKEADKKSILFTSALSGEGKTSAVANLAILSAREGKKVLLIDGDMRRPNLHYIMRLPNRLGLSSILAGYSDLSDALCETEIPQLHLLPAGPIHPSPAELLSSPRMQTLMQACKQAYDLIYIDSPPLLSVSDANILSRSVDGIVLVVRSLIAKKEHLRKCNHILEPTKHKVMGMILNDKQHESDSIV